MEPGNYVILHPNVAFVYKIHKPYIKVTNKKFETQFDLVGSEGIERSSVDLQFEEHRVRVTSLTLVELVTKGKPAHVLKITGEVGRGILHEDVESLTGNTSLRYVLTSISTEVFYSLSLTKSPDEDSELQQTIFVKNDSKANHAAFLSYNSAPYAVARAHPQQKMTYMTRSADSTPDLNVLRPKTITIGERVLEEESIFPTGLMKLSNIQLHFEVYISLLRSVKNEQATPAIKLPLDAGNIVEGQLRIFDDKGYYLTAGQLRIGASSARAMLNAVNYGVRVVDAETSLDLKGDTLHTRTQLTAFNSGEQPLKLFVNYESRLNFTEVTFIRSSTRKSQLLLQPGKTKHLIELKFTRIKKDK